MFDDRTCVCEYVGRGVRARVLRSGVLCIWVCLGVRVLDVLAVPQATGERCASYSSVCVLLELFLFDHVGNATAAGGELCEVVFKTLDCCVSVTVLIRLCAVCVCLSAEKHGNVRVAAWWTECGVCGIRAVWLGVWSSG